MTDCKHQSFVIEIADARNPDGTPFTGIGIARCLLCGTAIGVVHPQMPKILNALDVLGEKIDALETAVKNFAP